MTEVLHVYVEPDGVCWFAQGEEVDYSAAGRSAQDAMDRFTIGLRLAIDAHWGKFGHFGRLLSDESNPTIWPYDRVQFIQECRLAESPL